MRESHVHGGEMCVRLRCMWDEDDGHDDGYVTVAYNLRISNL